MLLQLLGLRLCDSTQPVMLSRLRSLGAVVSNTGSTARDHLANERTYLAWLRTSLALVLLGVGVERFSLLRADLHLEHASSSSPSVRDAVESEKQEDEKLAQDQRLAEVLTATGAATATVGTWRYFATIRLLQREKYRPNVWGVVVLTSGGIGVLSTILWARWHDSGTKAGRR